MLNETINEYSFIFVLSFQESPIVAMTVADQWKTRENFSG
jgi:hypothetical protein